MGSDRAQLLELVEHALDTVAVVVGMLRASCGRSEANDWPGATD